MLEAMYGLELLKETDFLNELECHDIYSDATSLIKLITSIIKPPLLLGQKKQPQTVKLFLIGVACPDGIY